MPPAPSITAHQELPRWLERLRKRGGARSRGAFGELHSASRSCRPPDDELCQVVEVPEASILRIHLVPDRSLRCLLLV